MELRHLRYFCAVAELRSFTLAARQLHVSQSGVSGQIRDLEREIGVVLLHRTQREVWLTPEGVVLFREAKQILAHTERALEMTIRVSEGQTGRLAIGLCGPATSPFLPALIRQFRKRKPGVTLSLRDFDPAHQPAALTTKIIDVGFTREIPPEFQKDLASEILFRESLLAVLPQGHPLAAEPSLHLAQLAQERIVLYARDGAPALFDTIIGACRRAKFSPRITNSPQVWQSVLTLVEAGEGIAVVPACVQHLHASYVVFRPLLDRKCLVDVLLAWRRNEPDHLRDDFLDLLRRSKVNERMQGV